MPAVVCNTSRWTRELDNTMLLGPFGFRVIY